MQRVLRKRVFRNLRKHFIRYFMLGLMIAMGIFLVVTIVGSGETLSRGTVDLAVETNLEDGQFNVFVPLTDSEIKHIKEMGIDIEAQFFYDYKMSDEDKGTVRIFKVRENINKIHYISGNEPTSDQEIVMEKRYAMEHDLEVGDSFDIAGVAYTISGIGVVSDYDAPFKEISDTSCNSKQFGLVYLTKKAYDDFKKSGKAQKSEEYSYAYILGGGKEDSDLKDYLKEIKIDASQVDDELFQEYWDRTGGVEEELRDAVKELRDATEDVRDALDELTCNNEDINDATSEILDSYLEQTTKSLGNYGLEKELTEEIMTANWIS